MFNGKYRKLRQLLIKRNTELMEEAGYISFNFKNFDDDELVKQLEKWSKEPNASIGH